MLLNFKWYRKFKGGVWWKVELYDNPSETIWMCDKDTISFPEFDGLFMDSMSGFRKVGLLKNTYIEYVGWEGMDDNPTEVYN